MNVSSLGTKSWTRGSLWWLLIKSPCIDRSSAWASASSVISVGWDSPGSSWSSLLNSSLLTVGSYLRVDSRNPLSLPHDFPVPSANWNMNSSSFCDQYFFRVDCSRTKLWCIQLFQILQACNQDISLPNSSRDWRIAKTDSWVRLSCHIDEFLIVFWRNRMVFNQCPKRYYWPFEWFSKSPFIRSFPTSQEVLDISQIAIAFHWIGPPPFIHCWL